MTITMQDREILKAIVAEAVAPFFEKTPATVLETRTEKTEPVTPVVSQHMTVDELVEFVREFRSKQKALVRTLERFRNHRDDAVNANRAINKARAEVEEAEEKLQALCEAVAAKTTVIERMK